MSLTAIVRPRTPIVAAILLVSLLAVLVTPSSGFAPPKHTGAVPGARPRLALSVAPLPHTTGRLRVATIGLAIRPLRVDFFVDGHRFASLHPRQPRTPRFAVLNASTLSSGRHTVSAHAFIGRGRQRDISRQLTIRHAVDARAASIPVAAPGATQSPVAWFNRFDYSAAPPASDSSLYQVETIAYQNASKTINTNLPDPRTASVVAAYHAAHPGIKLLLYRNSLIRNDDPNGIGTCTTVANTDPSWYLHNADGSRVYQAANNGLYFADIANPAFQAACAAHTVAATKANGYDGIFLDIAMSTRLDAGSYPGCPGGSFTCSNNLAYDLEATSFLQAMTKAAHAAGLILIANVGLADYPATQAWWTLWNSIADGAMEESWSFGTDAKPVNLVQWKTELANVQFNETHGKYTLLNADTFGNHVSDLYALASMLLVAGGHTSYDAADGNYGNGEYWWPEYSASQHLGPALGAYTVLRDGLYVRRFVNGTVVVNPNTVSVTDPTYGTLAAHTGQINPVSGH